MSWLRAKFASAAQPLLNAKKIKNRHTWDYKTCITSKETLQLFERKSASFFLPNLNLLVFIELCPESLLESLLLLLFLFEAELDCMDDLAEVDLQTELSAKQEEDEDSAPSSESLTILEAD